MKGGMEVASLKTMKPVDRLREVTCRLEKLGVRCDDINVFSDIFTTNEAPYGEVRYRKGRKQPQTPLDAALYPYRITFNPEVRQSKDLEVNSKCFDGVAGIYIAGTRDECINIGQSDVDMLGRLCDKKEVPDHQWWVQWCHAVAGMEVEPGHTLAAQTIALEVHHRGTELDHPRGHKNNS
jgi:hypothetical protein